MKDSLVLSFEIISITIGVLVMLLTVAKGVMLLAEISEEDGIIGWFVLGNTNIQENVGYPAPTEGTELSLERLSLRRRALYYSKRKIGILRTSTGYKLFKTRVKYSLKYLHPWAMLIFNQQLSALQRCCIFSTLVTGTFFVSIWLNLGVMSSFIGPSSVVSAVIIWMTSYVSGFCFLNSVPTPNSVSSKYIISDLNIPREEEDEPVRGENDETETVSLHSDMQGESHFMDVTEQPPDAVVFPDFAQSVSEVVSLQDQITIPRGAPQGLVAEPVPLPDDEVFDEYVEYSTAIPNYLFDDSNSDCDHLHPRCADDSEVVREEYQQHASDKRGSIWDSYSPSESPNHSEIEEEEMLPLPLADTIDDPGEEKAAQQNPLLHNTRPRKSMMSFNITRKGLRSVRDVVAPRVLFDATDDSNKLDFSLFEMIMVSHVEDTHCRYLAALSVKMSARLYAAGILPYSPPVDTHVEDFPVYRRRSTVCSGVPDNINQKRQQYEPIHPGGMFRGSTVNSILNDPSVTIGKSVILDKISNAEHTRSVWRLACEAVVLFEFKLASTLFILDVISENPDLFYVLIGINPPVLLRDGLLTLVYARHVGKEWCQYYAEKILGQRYSEESEFLKVYNNTHCCPEDLLSLLFDPLRDKHLNKQLKREEQQASEDKSDNASRRQSSRTSSIFNLRKRSSAGGELNNHDTKAPTIDREMLRLQQATTIEHCAHHDDENLEDRLMWGDGIDAICDLEFVRASHIFRAAHHPMYFDATFPVHSSSADRSFFETIEYGRLVARHYAKHECGISAGAFAKHLLEEEQQLVTVPLRLFAYPAADGFRHDPNTALDPFQSQGGVSLAESHPTTSIINSNAPGGSSDGLVDDDIVAETRNNYLTYLVNQKLSIQQDSNCSGELYVGPPGNSQNSSNRSFASWVSSRWKNGSMLNGTGTFFLPFVGLESCLPELKQGDHIILLDGEYPPAEIRGLHGTADLPLYISPWGYKSFFYDKGFNSLPMQAEQLTEDDREQFGNVVFRDPVMEPGVKSKEELLRLIDCSHVRIDGIVFTDANVAVDARLSDEISLVHNKFHNTLTAMKRFPSGVFQEIPLYNSITSVGIFSKLYNAGSLQQSSIKKGYIISFVIVLFYLSGWFYIAQDSDIDDIKKSVIAAFISMASQVVLWNPLVCIAYTVIVFCSVNLEPVAPDSLAEEINPSKRHSRAWANRRDRSKADFEWTSMSTSDRRYLTVLKQEYQTENVLKSQARIPSNSRLGVEAPSPRRKTSTTIYQI